MARRRRPLGPLWLWAASFLLAFTGLTALWFAAQAERKLSTLVLGGLGESFSTRIWSAPFRVKNDARGESARLIERLDRLGYRRTENIPVKGEYRWAAPELSVYLRGHRIQFRPCARGKGDVGTLCRQRQCNGAANSPTRAGDNPYLSFQSLQSSSSLSIV